ENLGQHRKHVLGAQQAAIEQRKARNDHGQHQYGGHEHPGGVAAVDGRNFFNDFGNFSWNGSCRGGGCICNGFGRFSGPGGSGGEHGRPKRTRAAKQFADHSVTPHVQGAAHSALSPVSPVRIRVVDARSSTKILPSPMLSVLAVCWIVSTTCAARASLAAISIFTLGSMLVEYSAPR